MPGASPSCERSATSRNRENPFQKGECNIVTPLADRFGINFYLYANLCTTAPLHFLGLLGLVILTFLNVRKKQESAGPEVQAPPPES